MKLHQSKYVQTLIAKLENRVGNILRHVKTPMKERREERDKKRAEEVGAYAEEAAEWIGALFWIARGTRFDYFMLYTCFPLGWRYGLQRRTIFCIGRCST